MQRPCSPLFKGPIVTGKWSDREERRALSLIVNFLEGKCPDCEQGRELYLMSKTCEPHQLNTGTPLLLYLATQLNSPVNRIMNKFVEKPKLLEVNYSYLYSFWSIYEYLQERYLNVTVHEDVEEWKRVDYSKPEPNATAEFESLIHEETTRFLDYLNLEDDGWTVARDRVFMNRIMNVADQMTPKRKRKRSPTVEKKPYLEGKLIFSQH